ncbi:hypothetical protein Tco_1098555 [Tanacetum coccineum]
MKIIQIRNRIQDACDRQKSFDDVRRKPIEFQGTGTDYGPRGQTIKTKYRLSRYDGIPGEALNLPGNGKTNFEANTHTFSQTPHHQMPPTEFQDEILLTVKDYDN